MEASAKTGGGSAKARGQIAVGVDAGSSRTRCLILSLENGRLHYLGCGKAVSKGWRKGRVADRKSVSDSISAAVREAEKHAGVQVESAVVGVGGPTVYGFDNQSVYKFPRPREVAADEMSFVVEQASKAGLENDRMIMHACPQYFTVDGEPGYRDPKGLKCSRLVASVHLVTTSTQETHNIVSAMHQAHLAVEETVFEPLAGAYASVLPNERSRGVAVVDIGMQSTDIVVYDGDALVHSISLPICSDHLTKDVAWGLSVSYEDAEALKTQYGCAILGLTSDNSSIVVPSADGREARELPRLELNKILDARAEELFLYVSAEIARAGMQKSLLEGVVLTGSAALLNGMLDMAERVMNCQARKGLTLGVKHFPSEINTPAWSTASGLAMYAARLKLRKEEKRRAPGLLGLVMS